MYKINDTKIQKIFKKERLSDKDISFYLQNQTFEKTKQTPEKKQLIKEVKNWVSYMKATKRIQNEIIQETEDRSEGSKKG